MKFDAALLAGGRSTRMGRDKAFVDWHGQPLWRAQALKLSALHPERLFIASRAEQNIEEQHERDPLPGAIAFVNDPPDEDSGPLSAITRCLRLTSLPLLVLAVDMPAMTADFLRQRLLATTDAARGIVFRSPHGFEALAALYVPAALPFFDAALRSRQLALQPLIRQLIESGLSDVAEVQSDDEPFFANVNTPGCLP